MAINRKQVATYKAQRAQIKRWWEVLCNCSLAPGNAARACFPAVMDDRSFFEVMALRDASILPSGADVNYWGFEPDTWSPEERFLLWCFFYQMACTGDLQSETAY